MTTPTPATLPADWQPSERDYNRAVNRYRHIDVEAATEAFVRQNTGTRKCRKDWTATWRGTLAAWNAEAAPQPEPRPQVIHDPVMYRGWEPDPYTMATLVEVFPQVNPAEGLAVFTERYHGVALSAGPRDYDAMDDMCAEYEPPFSSWVSAFRAFVASGARRQDRNQRNRRNQDAQRAAVAHHEQVEALTVRTRGHLRLLHPA